MSWDDAGPWKKIVVHRDGADCLEETVAYRVPVGKFEEVRLFDDGVAVDLNAGMLSSHSDGEARNYLALNLAGEIAEGKRSVGDAKAFFMRTERLSQAGKSSPYTHGLMLTGGGPD